MKKILIILTGLLVVLVAALVIVPTMIDWSKYQDPAVVAVRAATGYDLAIDGSLYVRVLPYPAMQVTKVRLTDPVLGTEVFRAEKLSASLSLFPLLTGRIEVGTISLAAPVIDVTLGDDGHPKLPAPLAQKLTPGTEAAENDAVPTEEAGLASSAIQIAGLEISDGQITVRQGKKTMHQIKNLDLDVALDDLWGPYQLRASGIYNDLTFKTDGRIGSLRDASADAKAVFRLALPDQKTNGEFDGMISRRAGGNAEGQIKIIARDIAPLYQQINGGVLPVASAPLELKATLQASPRNIVLDNLDTSYGAARLTGVIKTRLPDADFGKPMIYARLASDQMIDLRPLLPKTAAVKPASDQKATTETKKKETPATKTAAKKFALPIDLDLEVKMPALAVGPAPLKDVAINISAEQSQTRGRIVAGALPGGGRLDLTLYPGIGNLVMAQGEIISSNLQTLVTDGLGLGANAAPRLRDVRVKTTLALDPAGSVRADQGIASWQGGELSFTGSTYVATKARPHLTLVLGGKMLDVDSLLGGSPAPQTAAGKTASPMSASTSGNLKQAILASAAKVTLPFDLSANLSFASFKASGHRLDDMELAADLTGSRLQVDMFKFGNWHGADADVKGTIADLAAMTGIDLSLRLNAADGQGFVRAAAPTWADKLPGDGPLAIKVKYKGDLDQAQVDTDITVSGLAVAVAGPVRDPFTTPGVDQVKVMLRAKSAGQAIKLIQPNFTVTPPLQGPLDLTAQVTIKDKNYTAQNITGQVGAMNVRGEMAVQLDASTRPSITGGLTLADVPLDALLGSARSGATGSGASGSGAPANPHNNAGRWSDVPFNTDFLRAVDADVTVAASRVTYHLWSISDAGLRLNLQRGDLRIDDVNAKLFGGTMNGSARATATKSGVPLSFNAKFTMADVNARSLTNALLGRAMNRVDGVVGMNVDVDSAGSSPRALIAALTGTAGSNGKQITVNGIDAAKLTTWLTTDLKPSTTIDGLMGSFMGSGATVFDSHTGLYTIKNGTVTLDQMVFDGAQARLETIGAVDLPAWRVDTKTTMTIKNADNVPPLTFTLKGPLDRPAQNIVGNVFENYLQQQLGKRVEKIIDKKLGGKLQDLGLGGLLGVPQQEPAPVIPSEPTTPTTDAPPPQEQKIRPEDVLIDVLKNLGR